MTQNTVRPCYPAEPIDKESLFLLFLPFLLSDGRITKPTHYPAIFNALLTEKKSLFEWIKKVLLQFNLNTTSSLWFNEFKHLA